MLCFPVMLRGRCSCAIPTRPTSSPSPKFPLSPIIPVHPGNSPVSLIIPVHTQKQGGGGCFFELYTGHPAKDAHPERARRGGRAEGSLPSFSPNPFLFSCYKYYLLKSMYNNIVGAPTFC